MRRAEPIYRCFGQFLAERVPLFSLAEHPRDKAEDHARVTGIINCQSQKYNNTPKYSYIHYPTDYACDDKDSVAEEVSEAYSRFLLETCQ